MADNKRNQDNLSEDEGSRIGQTGGQSSHSGQKGGQAQSDYGNTNSGRTNDPASDDTSLADEDL